MKQKRLLLVGLLLVFIALVLAVFCFRSRPEPSHNGKRLSTWFKEYTSITGQSPFAPPSAGIYYSTSTNPPTWITAANRTNFIIRSNRNGWIVVLTNHPVVAAPRTAPTVDEPWQAIRAIGSNAASYLAAQMHHGHWEQFYERNFTNVPALLQKKLPNPAQRWLYRLRAIEIADRLGPAAHETAPAMLELLREGNLILLSRLTKALRSVRADSVQIASVILQLGAERRYAEVLGLVGEFGIKDPGVARLLGQLLISTNQTCHRDAIRLLEGSGARAAPAAPQIIAAFNNPDAEVRYLAARSVEMLSQRISPEERPALAQLLRAALADKSVMVRNVSRRVLTRMGITDLPAPFED